MASINFTEFERIAAIYEQQAEGCVRSIEALYEEVTRLAARTAYHPLVDFANQIDKFYQEDLRKHLKSEYDRWYNSEYSFQALAKNIGAGESAVQKARRCMEEIGECLRSMFRRGTNHIDVVTTEPHIQDYDFKNFQDMIERCFRNCSRANDDALTKIKQMAEENNMVSCMVGFVKSMGVSITGAFEKMIAEVESGLGLFRTGVSRTVDQVPGEGRMLDVHISWRIGTTFL